MVHYYCYYYDSSCSSYYDRYIVEDTKKRVCILVVYRTV